MAAFSNAFAGECIELMHDYIDICRVLQKKRRNYEAADVPNFDYEKGEPIKKRRVRRQENLKTEGCVPSHV